MRMGNSFQYRLPYFLLYVFHNIYFHLNCDIKMYGLLNASAGKLLNHSPMDPEQPNSITVGNILFFPSQDIKPTFSLLWRQH